METWPAVAWFLLFSHIADWLQAVHSRDFTVQDIIFLYPSNTRYCYSQHIMDVTGESSSVTKSCASLEQCLNTGCRESGLHGHKVCTSCCEGNICNMAVPRNDTDAVFATTSPLSHSERHSAHSATYLLGLLLTLWLLVT
ncbi:hypothetical protein GDO81_017530 [Engystomops pustulosus]|uniref:Ly6/PLAUR domain-containing protein 6 n=1 Tax=Engystomops pustulosus TaxID=76066 RepID=A0AAV7AEM1_ENGPU|nr:hypothetical protein GDO81_017530 [Engystomops pustulosus]